MPHHADSLSTNVPDFLCLNLLPKTAYMFAYMNRSFGEWSDGVENIPNSLSERDCYGQRLPNVNEVNGKEGVRK